MKELEEYRLKIEKAREAYYSGNLQMSIRLFEEAMGEVADENDVLDLGLLYMESGDFLRAEELIKSIIDRFSDHPRGYYCLGYVLEEIEEFDKALENYKKAYSLDRKSGKYCFALARMYDQVGKDNDAINLYIESNKLLNGDFWSCLNLGSLYERNNLLKEALEKTQEAYSIDPSKEMVNYNLGVIYSRMGENEKAVHHYLEEIKNKKSYNLAYFNLGILYKDIYNDYENAKYYYLRGIQKDQDNISLWYNLGCVYALEEKYEDAYRCLLYSCMKNDKVFDSILRDKELDDFVKSEYYEKLIKELKR